MNLCCSEKMNAREKRWGKKKEQNTQGRCSSQLKKKKTHTQRIFGALRSGGEKGTIEQTREFAFAEVTTRAAPLRFFFFSLQE